MNRPGGSSLVKKVSSLRERVALKEQGRFAFVSKKTSQPIKGGLAIISEKSSAVTRTISGTSTSSQGKIGTKVAKVSKTLGNLGRKAVSTIKTTAVSNEGTHFVRTAAPRTATLCGATLTLCTFLGSMLLVTSTVAAGYLTYVGIKDLFGEKKR